MRRVEFIINEIRRTTNNRDLNSKTNYDIVNYLNRAQRAIQKIILNSNTDTMIFSGEQDYTLVANQRAYDLPSDIYAQNAIIAVMISVDGYNWSPLRFITPKEFRTNYGYYLDDKELYLIPTPTTGSGNKLKLHYTKKLPMLAKRAGKISASTSGVSVTIPSTTFDLSEEDDYFCVVDRDGAIKESELIIDSYTPATGVILTSSTFTTVTTDDYVVVGKNATSHSEMPDACEDYLMKHVERSIFHQDSSSDTAAQDVFTTEERSDLAELFAQNTKDVPYPPITDTTYVGV